MTYLHRILATAFCAAALLAFPQTASAQGLHKPSLSTRLLKGASPDEPIFSYGFLQGAIGSAGIVTVPDQRAPLMLISAGGGSSPFTNRFWVGMRWEGGSLGFRQEAMGPYFEDDLHFLQAADVFPGGGDELVAVTGGGRVVVYDLHSWKELAEFQVPISINGWDPATCLADVSGDGFVEFIFAESNKTRIYDIQGFLLMEKSFGGGACIVAQLDGDPALELATSDGTVLDLWYGVIECQMPGGFSGHMEALDVDGDGIEELIGLAGGGISAFDIDTCSIQWTIPVSDVRDLILDDLDQDGLPEILVARDYLVPHVSVFSPFTLAHWGDLPGGTGGSRVVAVADLEGDGERDILYVTNKLRRGSWKTWLNTWEDLDLSGPSAGPLFGDVDGDGLEEMVISANNIMLFGAQSMKLKQVSTPVAGNGYYVLDMCLADLDGDGDDEMVFAIAEGQACWLRAWDVDSSGVLVEVWSIQNKVDKSNFTKVRVADLDGDGSPEILGCTDSTSTWAPGNMVYAYDYPSGNLIWTSPKLGPGNRAIDGMEIADIDMDGSLEILLQLDREDAIILDATGQFIEAVIPGSFSHIRVQDGPIPEIVLGDTNAKLHRYTKVGFSYQGGIVQTLPGNWVYSTIELDGGYFFACSGTQLSRYESKFDTSPTWSIEMTALPASSGLAIRPYNKTVFYAGAARILGFRAY